jgi:molybdopterin molybdotransferase
MSSLAQTVSCIDGYDPDALPVDKARAALLACIAPLSQTESLQIRAALGRVLAEEIVPTINVPSNDNSAMDGYAVRFADLDKPLKEVGTALAGKPFGGKVGAGECVRIMTGAVMPEGSDTVVIQEIVKKEGGRIVVPTGQKKAQNVRYAGEDLKVGVAVLEPGKLLRPAELGLIASLGIGEVKVKRKLRVALFHSRKARCTTRTATRYTACSRASASRSSTWVLCVTTPPRLKKHLLLHPNKTQSSRLAASRSAKPISSSR